MKEFRTLIADTKSIKSIVTETNTKIDSLSLEVEQIKQENQALKQSVEELSEQNAFLKRKLLTLDQYSRKCNIVINGVPQTQDEEEDIYELVKKVATALDVKLEKYDISIAHRLPNKKLSKAPPIIVKLNNLEKKRLLVSNSIKMKLKGDKLGFSPALSVYVNEHLTKESADILNEAKSLKKDGLIAQAWYRNGCIYIRNKEDEPSRIIYDISELSSYKTSACASHHQQSNEVQKSSGERKTNETPPEIEETTDSRRDNLRPRSRSQTKQTTLDNMQSKKNSSSKSNKK